MTGQLRVMLVDDHDVVRAGTRALLADDVDVVGEADNVESAIELVLERAPDLVLLDVRLPGGGGWAVIRSVKPTLPDVRFLAFTVSTSREDVLRMFEAGVDGYATKSTGGADLLEMIRLTAAGSRPISPEVAGHVLGIDGAIAPARGMIDRLTPREREVVHLIARGFTYKETASRLAMSVKTLENHMRSVFDKLSVESRHELTTLMYETGFLRPDDLDLRPEFLADRAAEIDRAFGRSGWLEHLSDVDRDLRDDDADPGGFRKAMAWAFEHRDGNLALRIAGGLGHYWKWRGRYDEATTWMHMALSLGGDDLAARAKVLREYSGIERLSGRFERSRELALEAAELYGELGDDAGRADALYDVGFGLLMEGETAAAEDTLWRSVELWEAGDQSYMAAFPLVVLAWSAKTSARFEEAEAIWDRVLADPESVASRSGIAFWRADLALDQGQVERAETLAREALEAAEEASLPHYAAGARAVLARAALCRGDPAEAAAQIARAQAGPVNRYPVEIRGLVGVATVRASLATGDCELAAGMIRALAATSKAIRSPHALLTVVDLGGELAAASGRLEQAVCLASASAALRASLGVPMPAPECSRRDATLASGSGAAWYEEARARGEQLTLYEAVLRAVPD